MRNSSVSRELGSHGLGPGTAVLPRQSVGPSWLERLRNAVQQDPLIETRPTLKALQTASGLRPPRAIFVGLGVCNDRQVSRAVPVDMLGLLLPAERIRRAVQASTLLVLVADQHALGNRLPAKQVEAAAARTFRVLRRLRALGLAHLQPLRASAFNQHSEYRRVLQLVRERAPASAHPYFIREVADVEYLRRCYGGILKVGWTIGTSGSTRSRRDEAAFDDRFRAWMGAPVGFVYCKAGRALDDARPRVSPYVAVDPERRICLQPSERVAEKLEASRHCASPETVRGVRRHLKRLTRSFSSVVKAVPGPVEHRVQAIIGKLASAEEH